MYRKIMLFEDLSVNTDGKDGEEIYASPKVVNIHALINKYQEQLSYKPPRMIYTPITVERLYKEKNGIYTQNENSRPNTAESLRDMIAQVTEMETLFQKQLLFPDTKKKQFFDQNQVQNTLRQ